jgi:arylsulfatase
MTTKQPNILFLLPDQHRPDWLGFNSDLPLHTPNLDLLGQRGIRFTNAFTPSPLCSPARACLATGRDYRRCGVKDLDQNTPTSLPNYYRHLAQAGYEVASVGKLDLHKPDMDWGLDGTHMMKEYGFTNGFDSEGKGDAIRAYMNNGMKPKGPYMQFLEENGLAAKHLAMYAPYFEDNKPKPDFLKFPAVTSLPDEAYCDNWVAANAIRYLQEFPKGKPWHLVVNFVGPHGPFDVTSRMRSRWENVKLPPPVDNNEPDADVILARRQNYAAMIETIDEHVGKMVRTVEQRGELENTIIVYSSDHGEMLGDHNRWGKRVWYTPSSGVPLIISGPGIRENTYSETLVTLHDLAATFLDYTQAEQLPESDARSLRPVLDGSSNGHREYVTSGLNNWDMIFDGRYKCVTGVETSPILYDLHEDPYELRDISNLYPDIVARLLSQLETEISKSEFAS